MTIKKKNQKYYHDPASEQKGRCHSDTEATPPDTHRCHSGPVVLLWVIAVNRVHFGEDVTPPSEVEHAVNHGRAKTTALNGERGD